MNITVTHTVSPELLAVLKNFGPQQAAPKETKAAAKKPGAAAEFSEPAAEENTSGAVTIEQVRAAAQKQAQAGKKEKIKGLLKEFEVDKVTSLAVDQYGDFLEKVNAL